MTIFNSRATGYYPDESKIEGGWTDMHGRPLNTLQDFLVGFEVGPDGRHRQIQYVSAAMDPIAWPFGTYLFCDELQEKLKDYIVGGRRLVLQICDTGGAFTGQGLARIDICTKNKRCCEWDGINKTLQFRVLD